MLFEARRKFEEKLPLADELIRDLKDNQDSPDQLPRAIDQCIRAAGHEVGFRYCRK